MSEKAGYELFADFEQKKEILVEDCDLLADYICHQINTGYRVRKFYGYSCYLSKICIMLRWKKERGLHPKTVKLDEAHSIDFCNSGSVWWGEP